MSVPFKDPDNPTQEEVLAWSRHADALEPEEDWDLIIAREDWIPFLIKNASDSMNPKREYFDHVLRLLARQFLSQSRMDVVQSLLSDLKTTKDALLLQTATYFEEIISLPLEWRQKALLYGLEETKQEMRNRR